MPVYPTIRGGRKLTHVVSPKLVTGETLNDAPYPSFFRRLCAPPRRQLATEEVDRELISDDEELMGASAIAALCMSNVDDEKEEARNRLSALNTFDLVGFGVFDVKPGTCTYIRERKETSIRQSITDRDALWDTVFRIPIVGRI